MKSFFKKVALVLALAMVVTMMPAKTVSAADAPQMRKTMKLYIGGDCTETYGDTAYAWVKYDKDAYTVAFTSDNEAVATVSAKKGLVTAKSVSADGATITATFTDKETGKVVDTLTCKVTVKRNAVAAGISDASAAKLEEGLAVGETFQPKVYRTDSDGVPSWKGKDAITDSARFVSTDEKVFTVSKLTGKVTAVGVGEAKLQVWAVQSEGAKKDADGKVEEYQATTTVREYTVKVIGGGLAAAKQTTFNTVAITCDTEDVAKAILDNHAKLKTVQVILNDQEMDAPVKSIEETSDAKVVKVVLYSNLIKDTTYKFAYDNGEYVTVSGADLSAVDHIRFTDVRIEVGKEEDLMKKVKFYDKNNIELPDPEDKSYNLTFKTDNFNDCSLGGSMIYFWEVNKQAAITAVYNMGYDSEGKNRGTKEDTQIFISVTPETDGILGWSVGGIDETDKASVLWRSYNTDTIILAAGDSTKQLYLKFNNIEADGGTDAKYNISSDLDEVAKDKGAYRYASSRDNVILIDADGKINPVAPGNAQIIVSKVVGNAEFTVKVINVTVVANRYLATLEANISGTKLSSAVNSEGKNLESLTITLTARDQLGAIMKLDGTDGVIKVNAQVQGEEKNIQKAAISSLDPYVADNNVKINITTQTTSNEKINVPILVTVEDGQGNKRTRSFTIQVKSPGEIESYQLGLSNDQIDLNFADNSWHWNGFNGRYHSEITLRAYDKDSYLVKLEDISALSINAINELQKKEGADKAKAGKFYFTVAYNQKDPINTYVVGSTFSAVSGTSENIEKISRPTGEKETAFGLGVYTVRAYRVNEDGKAEPVGVVKNIRVIDTSKIVTCVVNSNTVGEASITPVKDNNSKVTIDGNILEENLTFKRDGKDIDKKVIKVIDSDCVKNGNTVYVRTITVTEDYKEKEDKFSYSYKINVNQQFYVK